MTTLRPIAAAAAVAFAFACASAQAGPNGNPVPGDPVGGASTFGAAQLTAAVNSNGAFTRGAGLNTSARLGVGIYEVIFRRNITACVWTGTVGLSTFGGSTNASMISVTGRIGTNNGVFVQTFNAAGAATDLPFAVQVICG